MKALWGRVKEAKAKGEYNPPQCFGIPLDPNTTTIPSLVEKCTSWLLKNGTLRIIACPRLLSSRFWSTVFFRSALPLTDRFLSHLLGDLGFNYLQYIPPTLACTNLSLSE